MALTKWKQIDGDLTGSRVLTGSLELSGSLNIQGSISASSSITGSDVKIDNWDSVSASLASISSSAASIPTLQQVTDQGTTTSNTIILDSNSADSPSLRLVDSSDITFNLYNDGANIFTITRQDNGGADFRLYADSSNYTGSYIQVGNGSTFGKDATIVGDLTVRGTVTAEEFHTEFVSASIIYSSGSTKFGDTSDDIHSFSGSLRVTGSGDHYFTDGNVGIGTTSPTNAVHVVGNGVRIVSTATNANNGEILLGTVGNNSMPNIRMGNSSNPNSFKISNSGYWAVGTSNNTDLRFIVNNTDAVHIESSNQNVGIGTTSPTEKLTVEGNISGSGTINVASSITGSDIKIDDWGSVSASLASIVANDLDGSGTANYVPKWSDSDTLTDSVIYDDGTNIGIGTSTPVSKLDVNGTITLKGDTEHQILKSTSNSYGLGGGETTVMYGRNILLSAYDDVVVRAGTSDEIRFFAGSEDAARMTIDNSGNVGIGTTSPDVKLHVSGSGEVIKLQGASGQSYMTFFQGTGGRVGYIGTGGATGMVLESADELSLYSGGSSTMYLDSSNNVGIGTTSPAYKVQIVGEPGSAPLLSLKNSGTLTSEDIFMSFNRDNSNTAGYAVGIDSSDNSFRIVEDGDTISTNPRIVVKSSSGKVGIGTSSPASPLHVYESTTTTDGNNGLTIENAGTGDAIIQYLLPGVRRWVTGIDNSDNDSFKIAPSVDLNSDAALTIKTNGNTGIGTSSPDYRLDVNSSTTNAVANFESTDSTALIRVVDSTKAVVFGVAGDRLSLGHSLSFGSSNLNILSGSGYVGIGTTSPSKTLHISNTDPTVRLQDSDGTNQWGQIRHSGANFIFTSRNGSSNGLTVFQTYDGTTTVDTLTLKTSNQTQLNQYGSGTYTGTAAYTLAVDSSGNIIEESLGAGAVDGAGQANYITRWQDSDTITSSSIYEDTSGNIGIGTTSPSQKLEVSGNTVLGGRVDIQQDIRLRGTDSLSNQGVVRFFVDSSDKLFIDTGNDGSNRFVIDSTGNVGIGTQTPSNTLTVSAGTTNVVAAFKSTDNQAWISVKDDDSGTYGALFGTDSDESHEIVLANSSATKRLVINTSGNVGIGTDSPSQKLTVAGNTWISSSNAILAVGDTSSGGRLVFGSTTNSTKITYASSELGIFTDQSKGINFYTNVSDHRMVIEDSGKIGIGTNSPSQSFEVVGTAYFRGGQAADFGSGDTPTDAALIVDEGDFIYTRDTNNLRKLIGKTSSDVIEIGQNGTSLIDNIDLKPGITGNVRILANTEYVRFDGTNRRVGIGTTTPSTTLQVGDGTAEDKVRAYYSDGSYAEMTGYGLFFNRNTSYIRPTVDATQNLFIGHVNQAWQYIRLNASENISFLSGSTETMRVHTGDGRVGIGTTSPSYTLDVSGSGNFTDGLTVTGSITHDGDLTVTGTVTAQEFHTEFVSASIIYQSGSTKFGDTSDDLHSFTGSVGIQSGSIKFETYSEGLEFYSNANRIKLTSAQNLQLYAASSIQFNPVGGTMQLLQGKQIQFNNSTNDSSIKVHNGASSGLARLDFEDSSNNIKMSISSSGHVGIGTSTPAGLFVVDAADGVMVDTATALIRNRESTAGDNFGLYVQAGTNTSDISFRVADKDNNEYLRVRGDGNVGIGTTSASYRLDVNSGTVDTVSRFTSTDSLSRIQISDTTDSLYVGTQSGKGFLGGAANLSTSNLVVDLTNGNVGIGTTTPGHKLDIAGGKIQINDGGATWFGSDSTGGFIRTFNGDTFRFLGSGNSEHLRVLSDGNVGIGTTSPASKLTIGSTTYNGNFAVHTSNANNRVALIGNIEIGTQAGSWSGQTIYAAGANRTLNFVAGGNLNIFDSSAFVFQGKDNAGRSVDYNTFEIAGGYNSTGLRADYTFLKIGGSISQANINQSGSVTGIDYNPDIVNITGSHTAARFRAGNVLIEDGNLLVTGSLTASGLIYPTSDGTVGQVIVTDGNGNLSFDTVSAGGTINGTGSANYITRWDGLYSITSSSLYEDSSGNVGIGTNAPERTLHLSSSANNYIRLETSTTNGYAGIEFENDAKTWTLGLNNSDSFVLAPSAQFAGGYPFEVESAAYNDSFVIKSGGNIVTNLLTGNFGIGTDSPTEKFHVSGSSMLLESPSYSDSGFTITDDVYDYRFGTTAPQNNSNYFSLKRSASSTYFQQSSGNWIFETNNSELVRITSDGKVGIGVTSPSSKLHVSSSTGFGIDTERGIQDGSRSGWAHYYSAGNAHILGRAVIVESSLQISPSSPDATTSTYTLLNTSNVFKVAETVAGVTVNNNILTVSGSNVGIGTASPSVDLDINGTAQVNNELRFTNSEMRIFRSSNDLRFRTANNDRMTIDSSGNVGIGITSPDSLLTLTGNNVIKFTGVSAQNQASTIETDSSDNLSITAGLGSGKVITLGQGTRYLKLKSSAFEYRNQAHDFRDYLDVPQLYIDSTGNNPAKIGIRNTSPSYTLDVSGSGNFTDGLTVTGSILHNGDLTVTGTVTAEEFHTEFISASIIYRSGSTKFGDTLDDIHSFTGSLQVSGSTGEVIIGSEANSAIYAYRSGTRSVITVDADAGRSSTLNIEQGGIPQYYIGMPIQDVGSLGSRFAISYQGSPNFVISGNSGIGINKVAPKYDLDVSGSGNFTDGLTVTGSLYVHNDSYPGRSLLIRQTGNQTVDFSFDGYIGSFLTAGPGNVVKFGSQQIQATTRGAYFDRTPTGGYGLQVGSSGLVVASGSYNVGIGTTSPSYKLDVAGDLRVLSSSINYQENTDVDTGTETVATVNTGSFDGAFFDYLIKSGSNLRAGTVTAIHDGTNVEYNEVSTQDLGSTTAVELSVDISGADMRLRATTTSDDWLIKSLVRTL